MSDQSRAPVERALRVLEAMNKQPLSRVSTLSDLTGLPPSTILRLLDQLIDAGYAEKVSRSSGYRLRARVRDLSWGFRQEDLILEAAVPRMEQFTAEHKWPVFIALPDGDDMIVRHGTTSSSPVSIDPDIHDLPFPYLLGAVGKAYLAFCPEWEREAILYRLARSGRTADRLALAPKDFERILREVRRVGYATTSEQVAGPAEALPPEAAESFRRVVGFAVPVQQGDRVLACLTMRFIRSAMTNAEAAETFLKPMQDLASSIASSVVRGDRAEASG